MARKDIRVRIKQSVIVVIVSRHHKNPLILFIIWEKFCREIKETFARLAVVFQNYSVFDMLKKPINPSRDGNGGALVFFSLPDSDWVTSLKLLRHL